MALTSPTALELGCLELITADKKLADAAKLFDLRSKFLTTTASK
jgi:predicted nucleic acid-binding protein